MKKIYFLLSLLLWILPSLATTANQEVIAILQNGDSVSFSFCTRPIIVPGENVEIRTDSSAVFYSYKDVSRIFVATPKPVDTKIDNIETANKHVVFKIISKTLLASGLSIGEKVSLYSMNGKLLKTAVCSTDSKSVLLPLYDLAHNKVYIVQTSTDISFKFIYK